MNYGSVGVITITLEIIAIQSRINVIHDVMVPVVIGTMIVPSVLHALSTPIMMFGMDDYVNPIMDHHTVIVIDSHTKGLAMECEMGVPDQIMKSVPYVMITPSLFYKMMARSSECARKDELESSAKWDPGAIQGVMIQAAHKRMIVRLVLVIASYIQAKIKMDIVFVTAVGDHRTITPIVPPILENALEHVLTV